METIIKRKLSTLKQSILELFAMGEQVKMKTFVWRRCVEDIIENRLDRKNNYSIGDVRCVGTGKKIAVDELDKKTGTNGWDRHLLISLYKSGRKSLGRNALVNRA